MKDSIPNHVNKNENHRLFHDHLESQITGDVNCGILTRRSVTSNLCMFVSFASMIEQKNDVSSLKDADWIKVMQYELNEFEHHRVWTLVPRPQGKPIIGTRWVFRNKIDEEGIVTRNKARLVDQGFCQLEGLDYDETFSPVAQLEEIRFFTAYASFTNFKFYQIGVKTTFLHGCLQEEVFLKQPPSFESEKFPDHVYREDKVAYGLKQAPGT